MLLEMHVTNLYSQSICVLSHSQLEKEIPTQAVTNIPPASQANNTQPETIVNFNSKIA